MPAHVTVARARAFVSLDLPEAPASEVSLFNENGIKKKKNNRTSPPKNGVY